MRFHSDPVEEHAEVPLADEGRWEALLEKWSRRRERPAVGAQSVCYVVCTGPCFDGRDAQLEEILGLVEAHGDVVGGYERQRCDPPNPRTWFGRGTCAALAERAHACGASVLVVDAALSPSQARNLEDATGLAVQDREGIILGVFRRHARSRTASIQVEIAQLEYLRPRIRGIGLDMDQQAGGIMMGKGAGETASELMARRLDDRLVQLRRAFERLQRSGEQQRRRRDGCQRVALVGYTNAGKTSLMNALTGTELSARDRPFETLDTTSRCLTRHGGDVLISDTVGFIRDLPERLMASFASTLAELQEATLLALVVDLSDPEWALHLDITLGVLARLGVQELPRLYVFHKADRVTGALPALAQVAAAHPWVVTSCQDPASIEALKEALLREVRRAHRVATLFVPYAARALSAEVHHGCRVLDTEATDEGLRLTIEGPASVVARLVQLAAREVA
jgi:GTP-binding protein HflX